VALSAPGGMTVGVLAEIHLVPLLPRRSVSAAADRAIDEPTVIRLCVDESLCLVMSPAVAEDVADALIGALAELADRPAVWVSA